jgi:hypothetical protein
MADQDHPRRSRLECFMRGGGLPGDEVQAIVRHLLTGCPLCLAVTRHLWNLGGRQPALDILSEQLAAVGRPHRRTIVGDRPDAP